MISKLFKSRRNNSEEVTMGIYPESVISTDSTMNFKIYNAIGGRIVEFYNHNSYTDRRDSQLFVIRDDEDFGEAIKNIAVTHMLSK